MKRRLLRLGCLLLLGATLNVAVAWGIAALESDLVQNNSNQSQLEMSRAVTEDGSHAVATICLNSLGGTWYVVAEEDAESLYDYDPAPIPSLPVWVQRQLEREVRAENHRTWTFEQRGWPFRALWCQYGPSPSQYRSLSDLNDANRIPVIGGLELQRTRRPLGPQLYKMALPLKPLWPGFAINTLFYAGVLWVLFWGPFALRRMIRKRRGHCPTCNYPIGQSPVCTECGAAVTP